MAVRKPLVIVSGLFSELPVGDSMVELAAAPSGLIFVGSKLGIDGSAQISGNAGISAAVTAQASGNAALVVGTTALSSGNFAQSTANTALASGNAGISTGLTALSSGNAALTLAASKGDVTLTGTQTLTNKTLTAPTIASANLTTALTLAGAAGTNGQVLTSAGTGLPTWTTVSAGFTLGTPVNTTSGTSITFTGIPAGVKQVIVTFKGVSTNGTSVKLVRIGPSAGVETSDYKFQILSAPGGALTRVYSSAGFIFGGELAGDVIDGSLTLTLENATTNSWAAHGGQQEYTSSYTSYFGAGIKSLAGVLSVLSLTTDGGTNTFDAGQVNIAYL